MLDDYLIARAEAPWNQGKDETLQPVAGSTAAEALDHWLSSRADILKHGSIEQLRWCLTDDDVSRLAAYMERWRRLSS